jgi:N-acetyl-gamma-glutamyl-phosphate reductase
VPFARLHPALGGATGPAAEPFSLEALASGKPDVVFLATPNETSAEVAAPILATGARVIDVSGAFRLRDAAAYPAWYGFPHPSPALLAEAVYGLTEWCGAELLGARLVANPGCYPTSVLLALKPVLSLLEPGAPVVADSKSGVSGAGKRADVAYSFSELSGNFKAYGVGTHRHEPEMRQELGLSADTPFVFVAHLLPVVRGILSTLHVTFRSGVGPADVAAAYACYGETPFVSVRPSGELPDLASVVGTPRAEIGWALLPGGRGVVVSVIDNLLKGAASQAVQNMNRVFGFPETEGLV